MWLFLALMLAANTGNASNGKELFRNCAGCHNTDNDQKKMGPSLRSLFGKVTLRNGKRADDANVREIIRDGFNGMPSFAYSFRPAEMDDLMAYLHTLTGKPIDSTTSLGEKYFTAYCVRCHKAASDLQGRLTPEFMKQIDEGHNGAPAMRDWLDDSARKALIDYVGQALPPVHQ
ncbi:MAG: cytochrome c [Bryobacteraceae bacterium]|jgi:cytochrome c2